MKIRRALLKSGVLAAVAAMAGGALWVGETPAQDATSLQTLDASTTSAAIAPVQIQRAWNTSNVSVSGIVSGTPESVSFSGTAKVGTRLAPDPDFGSPNLVLSIDAIGGPEIVQKRLAASHLVEITFPFYKNGTDGTTGARSGAASFTIDVDMATGAVTNATGNIGSSPL